MTDFLPIPVVQDDGTLGFIGWFGIQPEQGDPVWEACVSCRREYRYPHCCREHMLCGFCHDDVVEPAPVSRETDELPPIPDATFTQPIPLERASHDA